MSAAKRWLTEYNNRYPDVRPPVGLDASVKVRWWRAYEVDDTATMRSIAATAAPPKPEVAAPLQTDVTVYTDGSAIRNPSGPGGWSWWMDDDNYGVGGWTPCSNQLAEMTAVLEAMRSVPADLSMTVVTDSAFVINLMDKWSDGWRSRGWVKADGGTPANLDTVIALWEVRRGRAPVALRWRRGHGVTLDGDDRRGSLESDIEGNLRADELATSVTAALDLGEPVPLSPGWRS